MEGQEAGKAWTSAGDVCCRTAFCFIVVSSAAHAPLLPVSFFCFSLYIKLTIHLSLFLFFFSRPYVRSKGRKFERARGRRASRGYKV